MTTITADEFKKCLLGFNISDCAVRDRNFFYFIAREDYTKRPPEKWDPDHEPAPDESELGKNVIVYVRKFEPGKQMSRTKLVGFERTMIDCAVHPVVKAVAVSVEGSVYSIGSGTKGMEANIGAWEDGGATRGGIRKLRAIDGWLYFCAGNNSVGKRMSNDVWSNHNSAIPNPKRNDHLSNTFHDIDGFGENDIYCVGTDGQVFHFDGKAWTQIDMPTNITLETVCCAGDGQVYISGKKGTTYRGRGNQWKLIHTGNATLPFRDMVWYKDRVWCTSDYGVWTIKNDKVEPAVLPDGIHAYAGNLSTADGVLLLAGYGGAAFLEGDTWTKIVSVTEMSRSGATG